MRPSQMMWASDQNNRIYFTRSYILQKIDSFVTIKSLDFASFNCDTYDQWEIWHFTWSSGCESDKKSGVSDREVWFPCYIHVAAVTDDLFTCVVTKEFTDQRAIRGRAMVQGHLIKSRLGDKLIKVQVNYLNLQVQNSQVSCLKIINTMVQVLCKLSCV